MNRTNVTWQAIQPALVFDGSWRDIYVLDTSLADWQAALALLAIPARP